MSSRRSDPAATRDSLSSLTLSALWISHCTFSCTIPALWIPIPKCLSVLQTYMSPAHCYFRFAILWAMSVNLVGTSTDLISDGLRKFLHEPESYNAVYISLLVLTIKPYYNVNWLTCFLSDSCSRVVSDRYFGRNGRIDVNQFNGRGKRREILVPICRRIVLRCIKGLLHNYKANSNKFKVNQAKWIVMFHDRLEVWLNRSWDTNRVPRSQTNRNASCKINVIKISRYMISFIKVAILFIINKGRLNENKKNVESHCN